MGVPLDRATPGPPRAADDRRPSAVPQIEHMFASMRTNEFGLTPGQPRMALTRLGDELGERDHPSLHAGALQKHPLAAARPPHRAQSCGASGASDAFCGLPINTTLLLAVSLAQQTDVAALAPIGAPPGREARSVDAAHAQALTRTSFDMTVMDRQGLICTDRGATPRKAYPQEQCPTRVRATPNQAPASYLLNCRRTARHKMVDHGCLFCNMRATCQGVEYC